jgi:hypothetical protein
VRRVKIGLCDYFVHAGVSAEIALAVGRAIKAMPSVIAIRNYIRIRVVPNASVKSKSGEYSGLGFAVTLFDGGAVPEIVICAGMVEVFEKHMSHREAMKGLIGTVLHEFVHYEQWRNGRTPTERGVTVRGRNLWKRLLRSMRLSDRPEPPTRKEKS